MNEQLVIIHAVVPKGKCSLSGKDAECVIASFADKSFENVQLSWNALKQLVRLKQKPEVAKK